MTVRSNKQMPHNVKSVLLGSVKIGKKIHKISIEKSNFQQIKVIITNTHFFALFFLSGLV